MILTAAQIGRLAYLARRDCPRGFISVTHVNRAGGDGRLRIAWTDRDGITCRFLLTDKGEMEAYR